MRPKLNINGLHPEIIKTARQAQYRFSYNQNVLDHSVETAFLASLIASEVGLDPNLANAPVCSTTLARACPANSRAARRDRRGVIKRFGETPIVVKPSLRTRELKPETVTPGS